MTLREMNAGSILAIRSPTLASAREDQSIKRQDKVNRAQHAASLYHLDRVPSHVDRSSPFITALLLENICRTCQPLQQAKPEKIHQRVPPHAAKPMGGTVKFRNCLLWLRRFINERAVRLTQSQH
ncbi:hypothetical protein BD410DRAFT_788850 [Rickenella mellea]|uniref:Uncharacterized protein n=1 Tax=Rickenella mellea TaxID=50990 RepID=A0A4Y7Q5F6_9AGAM|nr:hypothetical protein BD410DRAFT_788850 [Rickenella mellea]